MTDKLQLKGLGQGSRYHIHKTATEMTSCHLSKSVLVGFDEVFLDLWVGGNSGKGKKLQNLC